MAPWTTTDFPPLSHPTRSTRPSMTHPTRPTRSTRPITQYSTPQNNTPTPPSILGNPPYNPTFSGPNRGGYRPSKPNPTRGGRWTHNTQNRVQAQVAHVSPQVVDEMSEKFDELEVIEESLELAANTVVNHSLDHNINDNDNDEKKIDYEEYEGEDEIPVEVSGENVPKAVKRFEEIELGRGLSENIRRCKYEKPTPIQCHAIPILMEGRDLMACAQTGSGKTAAFCFPIIAGILSQGSASRNGGGGGGGRGMGRVACPVALIMSPTRELSSQIHDEAKKFAYQTGLKIVVAYGGTRMSEQIYQMDNGVDILVATPGRLVDMIERGRVSLHKIKYFTLDEADRMLDMGFEPQIRKIAEQMDMPPPGARQTMLFSATFPTEIQRLASDFLSNYIFLTVGKVGSSNDLIEQKVEFVRDFDKKRHLKDILVSQKMNGTNGKHPLTIIFAETKRTVDDLASWLSRSGFPATAIHGDKVQMERERALRSFKNGATPIIVATDVAARGLDIPCVAHVINFDLPRDIEHYVHRIGRTGRAGKTGLATAFFCDKDLPISKALAELMEDANQAVPAWLTEYSQQSSSSSHRYGGGFGGRRSRGSNFGGRDYRSFNHGTSGYSGYSENSNNYNQDYSSAYTDEAPPAESFSTYADEAPPAESFSAAGYNPYPTPAYGSTHGYETIVASGWD